MKHQSKRLPLKALTVFLAVILCFSLTAILFGCDGSGSGDTDKPVPVTPPEETPKVHSVAITYNDAKVEGLLSVDIAQKNVKISATVSKDEGAEGTLAYESSDKTVATIDGEGNVALLKAGETVLTASYGSESCSVVLSVESGYVNEYSITVVDGTASVSTAAEGEIVTITPTIPEHKEFSDWSFEESETSVSWISGNMFKMPAGDVTVAAEFTDMLYSLRLVGAKVTDDGSEKVQEGTVIGYEGEKQTAETAITEYKYPFEASLSFEAVEPESGNMFVGWDENVVNNRLDEEETIEDYVMPDETTTLWANFSPIRTKKLLTAEEINGWSTTPIEEPFDEELEGFSGYEVIIPAGTIRSEGYNEDIHGSDLNTVENPSQAIRAIFRNRGDKPVTVEIYASYLTNLATSGWVTVQPGETVSKTFVALLGFQANPWWGFSVRETVGDGADVPLDIVLGCADAYPKGDKTLSVTKGTQRVELSGYKAFEGSVTARVDNKNSWTLVTDYEHNAGVTCPFIVSARLTNLPAYDTNDPYITLYIKMQNQAASDHSYDYTFAFGKNENPLDEEGNVKEGSKIVDFTVYNQGETKLFAIRLPRGEADTNFYFSMIKRGYDTPDNSKPASQAPYYAMNYSVVLTYNNGIGFNGEVIE